MKSSVVPIVMPLAVLCTPISPAYAEDLFSTAGTEVNIVEPVREFLRDVGDSNAYQKVAAFQLETDRKISRWVTRNMSAKNLRSN